MLEKIKNSFNKMVQDLKNLTGVEEHRKQLAVLNAHLQKEIAERKSVEEKLQCAYDQLKQAQPQLFQPSKIASIATLAGGVAHEINNPLTGVLNNVQLIKMLAQDRETFSLSNFRELLDAIEDSANRCSRITTALLDFSHASKVKYASLAINEVVDKVLVFTGHDLSLENIKIDKQLEPGLLLVKGDHQLLQQAIMNLLSNARWAIKKKYGKEGGTIVIRSGSNPGENGVDLVISDNGIGISQDNLAKIFEPFFTTKEVGEGTGLGLAVVYNIVMSHHGKITVQSESGQGAEFKIFLPAA
ncbi:MAG: ATP-binding protein [Candidatus Omnitrophota bacterium]